MQIPLDLPEPDNLAGIIRIDVSRVRLEADQRWRDAMEKLQARRSLRRVAEAVYRHLSTPRQVAYTETVGILRPKDLSGNMDLRFVFSAEGEEDHFHFELGAAAGGVHYEIRKALKEFGEPWGGGVVPQAWKEQFISVVRAHPAVWQLSERIVRLVEPHEITWDWQPAWNLTNVPAPHSGAGLDAVFPDEKETPKFVLLAAWSFALEEHDWGSHGNRVQLVIDPFREEVVKAWEDEWQVFF